jgi:hypothetical protein
LHRKGKKVSPITKGKKGSPGGERGGRVFFGPTYEPCIPVLYRKKRALQLSHNFNVEIDDGDIGRKLLFPRKYPPLPPSLPD